MKLTSLTAAATAAVAVAFIMTGVASAATTTFTRGEDRSDNRVTVHAPGFGVTVPATISALIDNPWMSAVSQRGTAGDEAAARVNSSFSESGTPRLTFEGEFSARSSNSLNSVDFLDVLEISTDTAIPYSITGTITIQNVGSEVFDASPFGTIAVSADGTTVDFPAVPLPGGNDTITSNTVNVNAVGTLQPGDHTFTTQFLLEAGGASIGSGLDVIVLFDLTYALPTPSALPLMCGACLVAGRRRR